MPAPDYIFLPKEQRDHAHEMFEISWRNWVDNQYEFLMGDYPQGMSKGELNLHYGSFGRGKSIYPKKQSHICGSGIGIGKEIG